MLSLYTLAWTLITSVQGTSSSDLLYNWSVRSVIRCMAGPTILEHLNFVDHYRKIKPLQFSGSIYFMYNFQMFWHASLFCTDYL